jgi:hypothetical protein
VSQQPLGWPRKVAQFRSWGGFSPGSFSLRGYLGPERIELFMRVAAGNLEAVNG